MNILQHNIASSIDYPPLFLKTRSISTDFKLYSLSDLSLTDYFIVDNGSNGLVKQGLADGSLYSLNGDLSLSSGDCSVFIDAQDVTIMKLHEEFIYYLDVSNNVNLTILWCFNNQLTSLDVSSNVNLTTLNCFNNQLTSLDVSNNVNLTTLNCHINQLTSLDVSNNVNLIYLRCYINQLTLLDVSNNVNLTLITCENNQLTSLDVSDNVNLTYLRCYSNQFTETATNQLLAGLRANNFSGVLKYKNNETGQGITDRAWLVTNGATITNYTI